MATSIENPGGMAWEPISPELALVDPDLAARARATLADLAPVPRTARAVGAPPTPAATDDHRRPYPFWARMTAALWLLVLGILIGGAAIPHAQDKPRVVPPSEDVTICKAPAKSRASPLPPNGRGYNPPPAGL